MKNYIEFPKIQVYKQPLFHLSFWLCPVDAILTEEKHCLLVVLLFQGLRVAPLILKKRHSHCFCFFVFLLSAHSYMLRWGENGRETAYQQACMVSPFSHSSKYQSACRAIER